MMRDILRQASLGGRRSNFLGRWDIRGSHSSFSLSENQPAIRPSYVSITRLGRLDRASIADVGRRADNRRGLARTLLRLIEAQFS